MGKATDQLTAFWNEVTDDFLEGRPTNVRPPLDRYFRSYRRTHDVQLDGFCEPFLGSLDEPPRMVFLSLNPGQLIPSFQILDYKGREGAFVTELRDMGSYTKWAASWPYLREPWFTFKSENPGNDHHGDRLVFMRNWYADNDLGPSDRVDFELYPWHSIKFSGANLTIDLGMLRRFVWDPVAELDAPVVFAFGAWWWRNLHRLGLDIVASLGDGGDHPLDMGYRTNARPSVRVGMAPDGGVIIAHKLSGPPPRPPRSELVPRFREQIVAAVPPSVRDLLETS